jgi:antitoxin HicB
VEREYTVILEPQPEGGYTVTVPALPGCITEGDTVEEALAMAQEAIAGHILALQDIGELVPQDIRALPIVQHVKVVA